MALSVERMPHVHYFKVNLMDYFLRKYPDEVKLCKSSFPLYHINLNISSPFHIWDFSKRQVLIPFETEQNVEFV